MTKKDIVKQISEELGVSQSETREIVQRTLDAIIDTLVSDMKIELRNFGVFKVKLRKARRAINPKTKEMLRVPEKYVVRFKPGKELKRRLKAMTRKLRATPSEPKILTSPEPVAGATEAGER